MIFGWFSVHSRWLAPGGRALEYGLETVMRYGGAEPGDRTMVTNQDILFLALFSVVSVCATSFSSWFLLFHRYPLSVRRIGEI